MVTGSTMDVVFQIDETGAEYDDDGNDDDYNNEFDRINEDNDARYIEDT